MNIEETAAATSSPTGTLLEVRVDRSRWLRGTGRYTGSMLKQRVSGHMCCMGFACRSAGHGDDQIHDIRSVQEMVRRRNVVAHKSLDAFVDPDSKAKQRYLHVDPRAHRPGDRIQPVAELIYGVNDDASIDDATRERHLKHLGLSAGIRFEFTGERLPPLGAEFAIRGSENPEWNPRARAPRCRATARTLDAATRTWGNEREVRLRPVQTAYGLAEAAAAMAYTLTREDNAAVRITLIGDAPDNVGETIGEVYAEA